MRLFFDARMLYNSGIGRYSRNLCVHLLKGAFNIEIILAGDPETIRRFEKENQIIIKEKIIYRSPIYSIREQVEGSWLTVRYKKSVSCFHYPHYNIPWFISDRGIVTIHDLIHLRFPEYFGSLKVKMARSIILRALKKAKRIIAVSKSTRRDLINLDSRISDKIRVVSNGVSESFKPISKDRIYPFLKNKGLDRYILYVGNRKPHKNLSNVLSAFSTIQDKFQDLKLVVIGERISESTENGKKNLMNGVVDVGYVNDDELSLYYNGAEVFLFPSLYEGFGFPPLEAMACGTPVITSNTSSLPEIVNDAGIMINPDNTKEIIDALIGLLKNNDLKDELAEKGKKRAGLFTWEKCAKETHKIYKEVVG